MDHPKTPRIIRETLLDVLDYCNKDFRPYYKEVAKEIAEIAKEHDLTSIVELGAGYAPLTHQLAEAKEDSLKLIPSDLYPETEAWKRLEEEYGDSIQPVYAPIDFTIHQDWEEGSGVVLCAALHHIPYAIRKQTLMALHDSSDRVIIFEPIRKTAFSMFLVLFSIIPALLTPLFRIRYPGAFRRILFCWLIPIVPYMFVWDGLVSCLRQWSDNEWREFSKSLPNGTRPLQLTSTPHSQTVVW